MTSAIEKPKQQTKTLTQVDAKNGGLQITDSGKMWEMAQFFAGSEMVGQCYRGKPQNILVAWQKGFEVGLSPTQALDGIAVINGRAAIWGETTTALVLNSGLLESHKSWFTGSIKDKNLTAHYRVKRKDHPEPNEYTFSIEDAELAGLWGRGTYKQYPKDMLLWKAKARAYRENFSDVLKGLMVREDMEGGLAPRRAVANTSDLSERTPPSEPDPLLDDAEPDAIEAEYEEQHSMFDGGESYNDSPQDQQTGDDWPALVQLHADRNDCTIEDSTNQIVGYVQDVWKKDIKDMTAKQNAQLWDKVKAGDLDL